MFAKVAVISQKLGYHNYNCFRLVLAGSR